MAQDIKLNDYYSPDDGAALSPVYFEPQKSLESEKETKYNWKSILVAILLIPIILSAWTICVGFITWQFKKESGKMNSSLKL